MKPRALVAGIGDADTDGFGAAVLRHLADMALPKWVRCADYGTGGMALALDLLDGYETVILLDVVGDGAAAGTVRVQELTGKVPAGEGTASEPARSPGTHASVVFDLLALLGGTADRVFLVSCEPVATNDSSALSEPVARAIPEAARVIRELVEEDEQRIVHEAISLEA